MSVAVERAKTVLPDPVTNTRFVKAYAARDLGERQALSKEVLENSALHDRIFPTGEDEIVNAASSLPRPLPRPFERAFGGLVELVLDLDLAGGERTDLPFSAAAGALDLPVQAREL